MGRSVDRGFGNVNKIIKERQMWAEFIERIARYRLNSIGDD